MRMAILLMALVFSNVGWSGARLLDKNAKAVSRLRGERAWVTTYGLPEGEGIAREVVFRRSPSLSLIRELLYVKNLRSVTFLFGPIQLHQIKAMNLIKGLDEFKLVGGLLSEKAREFLENNFEHVEVSINEGVMLGVVLDEETLEVTQIAGEAERESQFEIGDRIMRLNNKAISNLQAFLGEQAMLYVSDEAHVLVRRGDDVISFYAKVFAARDFGYEQRALLKGDRVANF